MKGELCIKSGYNFLSSTLKIDDIINLAIKHDYDFIALVDKNVLHGALEFYLKAKKNNLNPIIGLEFELDGFIVSLLAKNEAGYYFLVKLSSLLNDQTKDKVTLDYIKENQENLIFVLPGVRNFYNSDFNDIEEAINVFKMSFSDFYLGMEMYDNHYKLNSYLRTLPFERVAFNNVNCQDEQDMENILVLQAIEQNKIIGFNRQYENRDYTYFLNNDEKIKVFLEDELKNQTKMANMCNLQLKQGKINIVKYIEDEKISDASYLRRLTLKGLERRNASFIKDKRYIERLNLELDVIIKMGFESYFLVVYDYVLFAKKNDIVVGPGRGSAAGSLVAYVLGITNIDPIKNNLLFERFLNIERTSMPDIDIDFQDNRRDEIITYLKNKYSKSQVANIVTFSTLAARQVLRDVGKTIGLSKKDIEHISRAANKTGVHYLSQMYDLSSNFKEVIESEIKYKEVFRIAKSLEGLPRQTSLHAAGVVIGNQKLENLIPTFCDKEGNLVVQYDMNHIEYFGLLKMDILGLKNLTIIDDCVKEIKTVFNKQININSINLEDEKIYRLISSGYTSGLFQLESEGMRKTIQQVKPKRFIDLASILALYRPGPRDFIKDFSLRKEGKEKIDYIDPSIQNILEPTYGIIVYQEQILEIAQVFAGFSLAKADILRRSMSKKDAKIMQGVKKEFIESSINNGHSEKKSKEVFSLVEKFASYGFNKAHSVSYAMISAQMAYLKYYYPAIFFASVMNNFASSSDSKFIEYYEEAKQFKINLLLPSINKSKFRFYATNKNNIYFSLNHIKGVNTLTARNIIKERENGLFTSYEDFLMRMSKHRLSKNQVITLIDAGALDEFKISRETLKYNYDNLEKYFKLISYQDGDQIRFDFEILAKPKMIEVKESNEKFSLEKEALGVFISGFPLQQVRKQLTKKGYLTIEQLFNKKGDGKLIVMINKIKVIKTRKGDLMGILEILDETISVELVVFPRLYNIKAKILNKGEYIEVFGKVQTDKSFSIIANEINLVQLGGNKDEK